MELTPCDQSVSSGRLSRCSQPDSISFCSCPQISSDRHTHHTELPRMQPMQFSLALNFSIHGCSAEMNVTSATIPITPNAHADGELRASVKIDSCVFRHIRCSVVTVPMVIDSAECLPSVVNMVACHGPVISHGCFGKPRHERSGDH